MARRACETCGTSVSGAAAYCPSCHHAIGTATGGGAPPPGPRARPAGPGGGARRGQAPTVLVAVAGVAAVAVGAVLLLTRGGGDTPAATAPSSATAPGAATGAPAEVATGYEIVLEPAGMTLRDAFSGNMATVEETPPALAVVTGTTPTGGEPGLYGGTRDLGSCDPQRLVAFLEENPDKAAAWAGVLAIDVAGIGDYVSRLTPVVLTRDTRVTNHGFRDGRAFSLQSVLQAGTAVLVDDTGVPVVKCACGNPLLPPRPATGADTHVGSAWDGFDPAQVATVTSGETVTEFVLVDVAGGDPFVRPVGPTPVDATLTAEARCQRLPQYPGCDAVATEPTTEPELLVQIDSLGAVVNGPTAPTIVTFDHNVTIAQIRTYHWNGGQGAPRGTIGLRASDGTLHGPWPAQASTGDEFSDRVYWLADVNVELPAGDYEVVDSDPSTWAQNDETEGRGIVLIWGW